MEIVTKTVSIDFINDVIWTVRDMANNGAAADRIATFVEVLLSELLPSAADIGMVQKLLVETPGDKHGCAI